MGNCALTTRTEKCIRNLFLARFFRVRTRNCRKIAEMNACSMAYDATSDNQEGGGGIFVKRNIRLGLYFCMGRLGLRKFGEKITKCETRFSEVAG